MIKPYSRRELLHGAGTTLFSAFALLNLKHVLAQAQATGRPVLSPATLATLLQNPTLLREFATDPIRFLGTRFELTAVNRAFLAHLAPPDLDRARQAAQLALSSGRPLAFQAATSGQDATQVLALGELPLGTAARAVAAEVSVLYSVKVCAQADQEAQLAGRLAAELQTAGIAISPDDVGALAAAIAGGGAAGMAVALFLATTIAAGTPVDAAVQQASQGRNSTLDIVVFLKSRLSLPRKIR